MKTCKTCSFWHQIPSGRKEDALMVCGCPKLTEPGFCDSELTDQLIYSYDEGGYFETGPDFGCVHHSDKTLEPDEIIGDFFRELASQQQTLGEDFSITDREKLYVES